MSGIDEQSQDLKNRNERVIPPANLVRADVWLKYRRRLLKYVRNR